MYSHQRFIPGDRIVDWEQKPPPRRSGSIHELGKQIAFSFLYLQVTSNKIKILRSNHNINFIDNDTFSKIWIRIIPESKFINKYPKRSKYLTI